MKLHIEVKRLHLRHVWRISRDAATYKENVFVIVEEDGVQGLGEAAPNIRYDETTASTVAFLEQARPLLSEADPRRFHDVSHRIHELAGGQTAAKAAIDMALLDWTGKRLGIPLYALWGLSPENTPMTSYSIGIDSPENIKEKVRQADPYPILKIKLGTEADEAIMQAVRQVTDRPVRVDANEGWTSIDLARRKLDWLAGLNVEFVEQPMPAGRLEEVARLRENSPLPLVADEDVKTSRQILSLVGAYDGINIKLMKAGGLQEALRMIHTARACGLKIMLGCMIESSLAITAAAHLSPLVDWADLDGNLLLTNDPFAGVQVAKGKLLLPDRPGVGVLPEVVASA